MPNYILFCYLSLLTYNKEPKTEIVKFEYLYAHNDFHIFRYKNYIGTIKLILRGKQNNTQLEVINLEQVIEISGKEIIELRNT